MKFCRIFLMLIRKTYTSILLASLLSLTACGTVIDKSSQKIAITAKGADEVWCYLDVNNLKFKAVLPQTINVKRSYSDLIVDCYATGNRHIHEVIPAQVNETTLANVANLGAGLLYDAHTGATHTYPDELVIDFTRQQITKVHLPAYMGEEKYKPSNEAIEYMGPTETKTKLDEGSTSRTDKPKDFSSIINENVSQ